MWRFIKGKSKAGGAKRTKRASHRRVKSKKRRFSNVARKRYSRRRGFGGGGKLMSGLFPVPGILGKVLIGAGIATFQEKFLPQMIPYQGAAAGFVVGGLPGAAGALARDMLKGGTTAGNSLYT
jgi:hypothetical protein